MKILALTSSPLPYGRNVTDGAGYRTWILVTKLAEDNDVNVLSLYEDMYERPATGPIVESGFKIIPTRCHRRSISQHINELHPDVMYVQSWPLHIFVPKARPILMIDFIGPSLLEASYLHRYPRGPAVRIKAEAFSKAGVILCANERLRYYLASFLLSRGVHKNAKLTQVICSAPPANPPPERLNTSRHEGAMRILVAGSLNPWYDYETLFKAASTLRDIDFQILFMGDNPPTSSRIDVRRYVNRLAEKYGLAERTAITGFVPFKERVNYYLQADVGLNMTARTLEDELSTRARLVDYLWAGLPVVTSGRDVISQMAAENNEARYFETGDWETLAKHIREVFHQRNETEEGRGNRSRVVEILRSDFNRQVEQLIHLLGKLTETKSRPSPFSHLAYHVFRLNRLLRQAKPRASLRS